jgi:hypothetical protein
MESFAKLNPVKLGIACGIVSALVVAITTIAGIFGIMGGFPAWNGLIEDIYGSLGYSVSSLGVILGAIYAFIDGFIMTWVFALIYNKLL